MLDPNIIENIRRAATDSNKISALCEIRQIALMQVGKDCGLDMAKLLLALATKLNNCEDKATTEKR